MSCDIGRRCGSDPALLWLWHRPAATARIRPLAWEPLYATGTALEKSKKKKKKKENVIHLPLPIYDPSTFSKNMSHYVNWSSSETHFSNHISITDHFNSGP